MIIGYTIPTANIPVGMGARLDAKMQERNINQSQLAKALNCDRKTIMRIISGEDCRISTAVKIADFMRIDLAWFITGKENNG